MKISKTIVLSLLVGVVIMGFNQVVFAAGNAGNRAIKKLIHPDSTRVFVKAFNTVWLNPDACDKSNQIVLASDQLSNENVYRELLAMLLTAHVAERRVEVRTNGCLSVGGTTFPLITQVTLL